MSNQTSNQTDADSVEKTEDLRTPDDSFIERKIRTRFIRSDWVMGRSVIEDELLVKRQGARRSIGNNHAKHKFEDAVSLKIKRVEDSKIHDTFVRLMTILCYAITMTTIVEFPFMCYRHGGITFFVPYAVILLLVGVPLMCVEMGLGQFCPLPIGNLFKAINFTYVGIGKSMLFVSFWRMLWNTERVIHSLYLSVLALSATIHESTPWTTCKDGINSEACFDYLKFHSLDCGENGTIPEECKAFTPLMERNLYMKSFRLTPMFLDYVRTQIFPTAYRVSNLQLSPWGVQLTLVVVWILICGLAMLGIKRASTGLVGLKIAAFLYIIGCSIATLILRPEDTTAGRELFFTFESNHLWDGSCWADAVKHVILSLSLCDGTIHKVGSLDRFKTSFYKSIIVTMVCSVVFSFFTAIMFYCSIAAVTVSMYNYKPGEHNLSVSDLEALKLSRIHEFTGHGQILMLANFAEYIISFADPRLFAVILFYYLSIAAFALPNAVMNMHKIVAAYEWSNIYVWVWKRWPDHPILKHALFSAGLGLVIFPCVALFIQPSGKIVARLVKHELVNALFIIGFVEILVIAYAYDAHRFIVDINSMHGSIWTVTACFYAFCYFFATPFLLTVGCVYHFAFNQEIRIIDYVVPHSLSNISVCTLLITIAPIVIYMVWRFFYMCFHNLSFRSVFQLTPYWFPPNREDASSARDGRLAYRAQSLYIQTKIDGDHEILGCKNKLKALLDKKTAKESVSKTNVQIDPNSAAEAKKVDSIHSEASKKPENE